MKKKWIGHGMVFIMISALAMPVLAKDTFQRVTAALRPDYIVVIDGQKRQFQAASGKELSPLVYDGSIYLPLRAIGEIMGKEVNWNNETKTVTLTDDGFIVTDADTFGKAEKSEKPVDRIGTQNDIGAERAEEIALNHAGLTAAQVKVLRVEADWDDNRRKYEVNFREGRMEYEYEIDAATGEILKAEKEYDD